MKFEDVLRRYHISPLTYDDGSSLKENDYINLLKMLYKYAFVKNKFGANIHLDIGESLLAKLSFVEKNSLIPLGEEEFMDILMEQKLEQVVKGD